MIERPIIELLTDKISGEWGNESVSDEDVNVIRTANFTNTGEIRFDNIVKRSINEKIVAKKKLNNGDIIIEKSGGSPTQPVGRVVYFEAPNKETYLCNNFTTLLRPNKELVQPRYLFYLLYYNYQIGKVLSFQNKTTGIINLKLDRYLNSTVLYEPDLETQNKVVAILDKVNSLIEKREKTIELYDELLRATFLDMFGDPVKNPKGWEIDSLSKFGSFKNGLNFTKNESGFAFRCLGVGDFKSQSRLSNIDSLSFINLSSKPQQDYFLQDGDLVFVRSNGNKELVGRCLVIFPKGENVTFSGFCIRYRTNGNAVNPIYLSHLFRVPSFKKVMLQNGRGANIQNINQEILAGLKIPIPSMELQTLFSQIVEKMEGIKTKYQLSLEYLIDIFNNLSQLAFKGELTFNTAVDLEVLLENNYDFFKANSTPQTIQLLLDRLDKNEGNDKKIYEEEIYQKAKDFVFDLLQEGRIKQEFDAKKATVKLSLA